MDKERRWQRTAGPGDAGQRLDQFWSRELAGEGLSREQVKDWIRAGRALVDGAVCVKPNARLHGAEALDLRGEEHGGNLAAEPGALDLLYRDAHLAVLDKPAGLTTHPAPGLTQGTLVHRLLHYFPEIRVLDEQRPGIVHRLDKDTSGLMVVALTSAARLTLAREFAEHRIAKAYLALVHGTPSRDAGRIEAPLGRHPTQKTKMAVVDKGGRPAESAWRVLWRDPRGRASLLLVRIFTGRTHQIRVHLAHIGHPIVGDPVYGPREHALWKARGDAVSGLAQRQMLHAFYLRFTHPESGESLRFWREPPQDFQALLAALDRRCLRVGLVGLPGSGKSALLRALAGEGAAVFSADAEVAELYAPHGDGAALLARLFGERFVLPDGRVDKARLFAAMKESAALRREVMDLVHPLVWARLQDFWAAHGEAEAAFAEIPLLQESGRAGDADVIAGIWRPEDSRRADALRFRGLPAEDLALLDSWQWSGPDKLRACQFVVENAGTLTDLENKARGLLRLTGGLARERRRTSAQAFAQLFTQAAEGLDQETA